MPQPPTHKRQESLISARFQVLACESELRRRSFEDIQRSATAGYLRGATYFEVNEAAVGGVSADCRFIDTQRLASDECEGSVEQVWNTALPWHS